MIHQLNTDHRLWLNPTLFLSPRPFDTVTLHPGVHLGIFLEIGSSFDTLSNFLPPYVPLVGLWLLLPVLSAI